MPDQVGHDGMVVGSRHHHSREHGNPWMPDQVGHDGLVVGHDGLVVGHDGLVVRHDGMVVGSPRRQSRENGNP